MNNLESDIKKQILYNKINLNGFQFELRDINGVEVLIEEVIKAANDNIEKTMTRAERNTYEKFLQLLDLHFDKLKLDNIARYQLLFKIATFFKNRDIIINPTLVKYKLDDYSNELTS